MTDQTTEIKSKLTEEEAGQFHVSARTILLAEGLIPHLDERVKPWKDSLYLAYFEDWGRSLRDYAALDAAVQDFNDYALTAPKLFPQDDQTETLTISRTHNFGAVSVTVGMSREFSVRSDTHRAGCYKLLDDTLDAELERWMKRNAGKVSRGAPAGAPPAGNMGGGTYKTEPALHLVHEFSNGSHVYKVKTPLYTKWGVALYPEYLEQFGYTEDNPPPMGETALDGWTVKILMDGDKPKKVVSASKAE